MKAKSDAHTALSNQFAGDGVYPVFICDNLKEANQGKFQKRLKDASCQLKHTEPYTSQLNVATKKISECKKCEGKKVMKPKALKLLLV